MIHWTFAQNTEYQGRHFPDSPEICFSDAELAEYRRIAVPKRAGEWLFSRQVVKDLARRILGPGSPALHDIRVLKEPGGVPFIEITGRREGWLSLSHSGQGVLAAFSPDPDCRFGVDLETIEPRSPEMIGDFFTPGEMEWMRAMDAVNLDSAANLVWSAKEAYLKAIGLGLGMDTRRVEIMPVVLAEANSEWQRLNFNVDGREDASWRVVYRLESGYILTTCVKRKVGCADSAPFEIPMRRWADNAPDQSS